MGGVSERPAVGRRNEQGEDKYGDAAEDDGEPAAGAPEQPSQSGADGAADEVASDERGVHAAAGGGIDAVQPGLGEQQAGLGGDGEGDDREQQDDDRRPPKSGQDERDD